MASKAEMFPLGNPSTSCGDKAFQWMLHSLPLSQFVEEYWEKKPCLVKRDNPAYFKGLVSRSSVEDSINRGIFDCKSVQFYKPGDESCEIPETQAELSAAAFKKLMAEDGLSCQVVHAHRKLAKVRALLERLENFTGSVWGSNIYLRGSAETGTDSQSQCESGSEPFQAISKNFELFILQCEGSVRWRVYPGNQVLARDTDSSHKEEDLGLPVLDEIVCPGDVLYIPRGFVHAKEFLSSSHLYLSLSTYQEQAWCDLLTAVLHDAVEQKTNSDVSFREGLPFGWTKWFGSAVEEDDSNRNERLMVQNRIKSLLNKVVESIDLDAIADQMGSDFIALRTAPVELTKSSNLGVNRKSASNGASGDATIVFVNAIGEKVRCFGPDPRKLPRSSCVIRFRNPMWIRVVVEKEEAKTMVFSCIDNGIRSFEEESVEDLNPTCIEVDGSASVEGIKEMLSKWPEFVPIELISQDVAAELWENKIVETRDVSNTVEIDSKRAKNSQ